MTFEELKNKAKNLPMSPGVYIMYDEANTVIYIGKAKKLRNRVSQYFQETSSHTPKTKRMVNAIHHFDFIVAADEFEALILECSLIKRHLPKYNILLKDDKGFPFIRLDIKKAYPTLAFVNHPVDDGAEYYGPFGSRGTTQKLLSAIRSILKLPNCSKVFPRDIGKERPCLNYHMKQCAGWCQDFMTENDYMITINHARQLLQGNYKIVTNDIRKQMLEAANELKFETAAQLRNQLEAIENLSKKQLVKAGSLSDTDVIGFSSTDSNACFSVLHFTDGDLVDKDYQILNAVESAEGAVSSLIKQYYLTRGYAPKNILLPFEVEDSDLFAQLLEQQYGKKICFKVPVRGDKTKLIALANKNAQEEADRAISRDQKRIGAWNLLGKMISVQPISRVESFDISNISGTDIVASMVVFCDGVPKKSDYKRFKIKGLDGQDDYASMRQVIVRRFSHYINNDKGFDISPDVLLIDGGVNHVRTVVDTLEQLRLKINVFGMVKDNKHRTRALVTLEGDVIGIDTHQSVFALVGRIQEETHRFAIAYHRKLRSKRIQYSELDSIPGIGPKRKQDLLRHFKSLSAISSATLPELQRILPVDAASAVYTHFNIKKG